MDGQDRPGVPGSLVDVVEAVSGGQLEVVRGEGVELAPVRRSSGYQVTLIMVALSPEPMPISAT